MALVVRLDKATLDRSALAAPQGVKLFEGRIARTHAPGDPLVYGPNDFEYRTAGELARILDHIVGLPITLLHPSDLIRNGAEAVVVGKITGARIDDDTLVAEILITDPRGVEAIADGVIELSMGYTANLTADHYQTNIHVDHVAIVPRARCGGACSLRADGAEPTEHVDCSCGTTDGNLNAAQRHELPAKRFAVPDREAFPINDPEHVRAAMARFGQGDFTSSAEKRSAFHRIVARAHELGIDPSGFEKEWSGKLDEVATCACAKSMPNSAEMTTEELQKQLDETKAALVTAEKRASDAEAALKAKQDSAVTEQVELDNAKKDLKVAQDALATEKPRADQAVTDGEAAVAKAKADAQAAYDEKYKADVAKRSKLNTDAANVLGFVDDKGVAIDYSLKDARELKVAVIKQVDGDDVPEKAEEAYVDGMFEGALRRHAKAGASKTTARETIAAGRKDSETTPISGADAEKNALNDYKRQASAAWNKTN